VPVSPHTHRGLRECLSSNLAEGWLARSSGEDQKKRKKDIFHREISEVSSFVEDESRRINQYLI
jgi:hypothetical protein